MGKRYQLQCTQLVPAEKKLVFSFFSEAANLEVLTPPFLNFKIISPPPIFMAPGTLIDYQIRLYGIPIGWRTKIESFVRFESFVDTQLSGPYRYWRHLHEFADAEGGTLVRDTVNYELPGGPLAPLGHVFVKRSLKQIFDFRREAIARAFE